MINSIGLDKEGIPSLITGAIHALSNDGNRSVLYCIGDGKNTVEAISSTTGIRKKNVEKCLKKLILSGIVVEKNVKEKETFVISIFGNDFIKSLFLTLDVSAYESLERRKQVVKQETKPYTWQDAIHDYLDRGIYRDGLPGRKNRLWR